MIIQQCLNYIKLLSQNIIKCEINLIFVQGTVEVSPIKDRFCVTIPASLSGDKKRWWIAIDEKRLVTKSFYESIRYMNYQRYKSVSIARDDVVRQIREHAFQSMSRTEESVKAGHNNLFKVELVNHEEEEIRAFTSSVCLYVFPKGTKSKTYHLLNQEYVEVIN
jgi:hypothetical protein